MHEGHMHEGHVHGGHHHRGHWGCCILPVVSMIFWIAAIIFTAAAWIAVSRPTGVVWSYGAQWWVVQALIFGLLALFGRGHKCHCGNCAGPGMYKVEHPVVDQ